MVSPFPENEPVDAVERLRQLGIPVRFDAYGPGTHDWPYWQRELHRSLPLLLAALRRPAPTSPTPQHASPTTT